MGEPAYGYTSKSDVQQNVTATSYIGTELKRRYRFIYLIAHTLFSGFECTYIKGRATWKIKKYLYFIPLTSVWLIVSFFFAGLLATKWALKVQHQTQASINGRGY